MHGITSPIERRICLRCCYIWLWDYVLEDNIYFTKHYFTTYLVLKYNPVLCKWLEYKIDLPWLNERYFLPRVYMLLQMWGFLSCKCFLEFFLFTPWRGKKQIRILGVCCLFGKEVFHEYQNEKCSMKNNLNGFSALYKQTMETWNKWKILNYEIGTLGEIRCSMNFISRTDLLCGFTKVTY